MTPTDRGTVLVDLSLELSNQMPAHAFFPSPIMLPYVTHEMAIMRDETFGPMLPITRVCGTSTTRLTARPATLPAGNRVPVPSDQSKRLRPEAFWIAWCR